MKRLVEETACVHGYFGGCTFRTDEGTDCPGGTSREVTVDYEAAASVFDWRTDLEDVKAAVDSALGGGL